jgi:hypothetical protein
MPAISARAQQFFSQTDRASSSRTSDENDMFSLPSP